MKRAANSRHQAAVFIPAALMLLLPHSSSYSSEDEPKDGRIRAVSQCAALAVPGDMLLIHTGSTGFRKAVNQAFVYPAGALDLLALNDPVTKFFHAEVIRGIDGAGGMDTIGFYPLEKKYHANQHLTSAAVYRLKGPVSVQEHALRKIEHETYGRTGFCGDYVAWAYDDRIYSWWNVVPHLRDILLFLYPPEAIHTPDDLANSPQTVRVCEVRNGEVVFPEQVETEALMKDLDRFMHSENSAIGRHARRVKDTLVERGAVDGDGTVLEKSLSFPFRRSARDPLAAR